MRMVSHIEPFELPRGECPADIHILSDASSDSISMLVGTTTGNLITASYDLKSASWTVEKDEKIFKKPIRQMRVKGSFTFMASSTGRIVILKDGDIYKKSKSLKDEEDQAVEVSTMSVLSSEEDLATADTIFTIAIGDDYGNVYILQLSPGQDSWETLFVSQEQDDSITDIVYSSHKKTLIASSGDGTLVILDLKKNKIVAQTSSIDDDILSLALDSNGNVVCSTGLGALLSYKWGYWGKIGSRLKPKYHESSSINSICFSPTEPNLLVTGSLDGNLRCASVTGEFTVNDVLGTFDDSINLVRFVVLDSVCFVSVTLANESKVLFTPFVKEKKVETQVEEPSSDSDRDGAVKPEKKKAKPAKINHSNSKAVELESFFSGLA